MRTLAGVALAGVTFGLGIGATALVLSLTAPAASSDDLAGGSLDGLESVLRGGDSTSVASRGAGQPGPVATLGPSASAVATPGATAVTLDLAQTAAPGAVGLPDVAPSDGAGPGPVLAPGPAVPAPGSPAVGVADGSVPGTLNGPAPVAGVRPTPKATVTRPGNSPVGGPGRVGAASPSAVPVVRVEPSGGSQPSAVSPVLAPSSQAPQGPGVGPSPDAAAEQAASTLVDDWSKSDQSDASSVATSDAIRTLFGVGYSSAVNPLGCFENTLGESVCSWSYSGGDLQLFSTGRADTGYQVVTVRIVPSA